MKKVKLGVSVHSHSASPIWAGLQIKCSGFELWL